MGKIFETLESLGLAATETTEVYSKKTRDIPGLTVYKDTNSEVIHIDDYMPDLAVYMKGEYHRGGVNYERYTDATRREESFKEHYIGLDVLDFGCGEGIFLERIGSKAKSIIGVEVEERCVSGLNDKGIRCVKSLPDIDNESLDSIFMFHVLEHLPEPIEMLPALRDKLRPGGSLIVEVPHARDFLLYSLGLDAFKDFTLWSQHLMLHTRESVRRFLVESGFQIGVIYGQQRYSLANHMTWAAKQKPGGHKGPLHWLDTPELNRIYGETLAKSDQTDTLIAIAKK